jgi:DtxR family Mn-dependent transcriptional regulator
MGKGLAEAFAPARRVFEEVDAALGEPATCPHGHPIPGRVVPYGELVALADLRPGTPAAVRRISEIIEHESFQLLRDLAAAGMRTGVEVTVEVDGNPAEVTLTVGDRRHAFALEPAAARLIWVEVPNPQAGPAGDCRSWPI